VPYAKAQAQHLNKNLFFSLVSNLTLLTQEQLDFCISQGIDICTSLDGDKELHNFNRSYAGDSFQEVTQKMQYINEEYRKIGRTDTVAALMTTTRKSLTRGQQILDTYLSLGLNSIYIRPLNPYGFASDKLKILGYTSQEFIKFYEEMLDSIIDINRKGIFFKE